MHTPIVAFTAALVFALPAVAVAGQPVELARGTSPQEPQQPQIAIDAKGVIHVAYGTKVNGMQGIVSYSRSDDGGKSFSQPVTVATINGLALGMRRGPRIAVSGDAICLAAIGHKDGNILLYRSIDRGRTWEEPVKVNDEAGSASEGLHSLAASRGGELVCVWLDHRQNNSEVFAASSTDAGKTWSKNIVAYRSPDGGVCPCCHPSVTYAPDGTIHLLWRNDLAGNRDMYHAVSSDGGKSFAKAQKLGTASWQLDRCPMDGGSICVGADGRLSAVWRREKNVYFVGEASSQEVELGPGEQPWLASSPAGPIAVWLRERKKSLLARLPNAAQPIELSSAAVDPVVATGGPKNEIAIAAWEEIGSGTKRIVCQRVEIESQ